MLKGVIGGCTKCLELEEARLRVNVVTEVENAITKALTLFRQEDVRAVRLAEKDDCTAVTGYELVHRVSRLGHRSLAHTNVGSCAKEDLGSLLEVVLRTGSHFSKHVVNMMIMI